MLGWAAMTEPPEHAHGAVETLRRMAKEHPLIAIMLLGLSAAGALAGFVWLPPDWSVLRRLAAGAVAGVGIALLLMATRIMGAWD